MAIDEAFAEAELHCRTTLDNALSFLQEGRFGLAIEVMKRFSLNPIRIELLEALKQLESSDAK